MGLLTKVALGAMGRLRPKPAIDGADLLELPPFEKHGGLPLLDALAARRSRREFEKEPLALPLLSKLLWAAWGINRPDEGGRTAPSALNAQELDVYVAMKSGAYLYEPRRHALSLVSKADLRRITGYQDFVDDAPVEFVYVADHTRMKLVPVAQRERYAAAAAGAVAQNVYLLCASEGLATVLRAWIDRDAVSEALGLSHDQEVVFAQTIGFPR
ncbi:MAG: SagB/ThcOx family dehydrogenase [Myxococcota bacterium]